MPNEFPWLEHLEELRRRLIQSVIVVSVIFFILLYFARDLYHLIALPLLKNLPQHNQLIATTITGPFIVPVKLAFYSAIIVTVPFFIYQIWQFVVPGLYRQEKRILWPFLFISIVLFYLGVLFAYILMLPMFFHFLVLITPADVAIMTDINNYLSFVMRLFIIFGVIFEIPIVLLFLLLLNLVDSKKLVCFRPYVIIAAFVIGMFLAPPDVISQTLVAIPIWLLYEIGLILVRITSNYFKTHLVKEVEKL